MKTSLLLALALALSGSALATDVDDFIGDLKVAGTVDDSSTMCKIIKATYSPKDIKCIKVDKPIYLAVANMQSAFLANRKAFVAKTSSMLKYGFGKIEFLEKAGGFVEFVGVSDETAPVVNYMNVTFDPVDKYTTTIVIYSL